MVDFRNAAVNCVYCRIKFFKAKVSVEITKSTKSIKISSSKIRPDGINHTAYSIFTLSLESLLIYLLTKLLYCLPAFYLLHRYSAPLWYINNFNFQSSFVKQYFGSDHSHELSYEEIVQLLQVHMYTYTVYVCLIYIMVLCTKLVNFNEHFVSHIASR